MSGFFERMGARAVGTQPRWATRPRARFKPAAAPAGFEGLPAGAGSLHQGTEEDDGRFGRVPTVFDGGRPGPSDSPFAPDRAGGRIWPAPPGQHEGAGSGGLPTVRSGPPSVPAPGEPGTRASASGSTPAVASPGEPGPLAWAEKRHGEPPGGETAPARPARPSASPSRGEGEPPHLAGTTASPGPGSVRSGRGTSHPGPVVPEHADPARVPSTVDRSAPASWASVADDPLPTAAIPPQARRQDPREAGVRVPAAASMEAPTPDQIGRAITDALREARLLGPAEIADTLVGDRPGTAVPGTPRPGHPVVHAGKPRTIPDPAGSGPAGAPPAGPPQMHVHIGRVQVQRAAPPEPAAPAPLAPARPSRLAAYLEGRDRR